MEKRDTPVEVKVCSRCAVEKHNSEFYRDASKPDGLQVSHRCVLCLYSRLQTWIDSKSNCCTGGLESSIVACAGMYREDIEPPALAAIGT